MSTRVALGNRLELNRGAKLGVTAASPPSKTNSGRLSPRTDYPGIFLRGGSLLRGGLSQYHDSELGDIYDLYNACNGIMSGELLDVRKLEELSAKEREVLDVERLREVWEHTSTGCSTCAAIIRTLNIARGRLRGEAICAPEHRQNKVRDMNDD
jgi:hypothetical protein